VTSKAFTLLYVDPDNESAAGVDAALRSAGIACRRVPDAETAWKEFARARPDAVLTAWETPKRGGAWLVRRVHDDYLGALPPIYGLFHPEELRAGARAEELDAAFVRPLRPSLIAPLLTAPTAEEQPEVSATRLRDLFELSLLTGDLEEAVRRVLERARRAFRSDDIMLATSDRFWRHGEGVGPDPLAELAVLAGTTLVDCATTGRSLLAAPLLGGGGEQVGLICLEQSGSRRYGAEESAALRGLGRRLGAEITWRAAQRRLAAEVGRLQETAKVDPLLGIMTRTALVDALAETRARGSAFALLVVDVVELKQVNERHGHVAGDAALARITQQVKGELPTGGVIGRLAGDKLAVFLPGLYAGAAQRLAEIIVRQVSATPVVHLGVTIPVAVRIGGALCPAEVGAVSEPLALAEAALLQAKRRRAPVFFHEPGTPMPSGAGEVPGEATPGSFGKVGSLSTGVTLGGMYQIRHEISRGAMGVVYRAEDLGLRRPVAVKVLRADLASDVELVERFRNEAALLASVRHDNLVAVHSFGTQGDVVFFVMELVEGESLAEMLRRADDAGEAIPPQAIADAVSQVADALTAMHAAGVVHRDVKPANVLIDRARHRAVLVDVGVARRAGLGSEEAVGTPGFAAPESLTKSGEGPQADVYGLAATAYMMLTNLAPFGGGEPAKVVRRQLGERPAPPTLLRRDLAAAVDEVFVRALAPQPEKRQQSAHELAAALGAALGQPPTPRTAVSGAATIDVELFETEERQLRALRGAVFRQAYRVLGNRLGSGWITAAVAQDPALLQVVGPQIAPRDWIPVDLFPPMVRGASGGRDPVKLAREIGRVAATGPFGRYDGEGIDLPEQLLAQPRRFWNRYASWGTLTCEQAAAHAAVKVADGPRDAVVCGLVEGLLERLTEMAGGVDARAWHVSCRARGDGECIFELRWTAPLALRQ
jgi:serine/threonine-protein kinase